MAAGFSFFSTKLHSKAFALVVVVLLMLSGSIFADDEDVPSPEKDEDNEDGSVVPVEENDVLVLNKDNFDDVIFSKDNLLVEFYAPWCGHCKELAPIYEKAAKRLKEADPPVFLAKVDATVETDLATRYDVSGYPTLKFFKNGKSQEYDGPRDEDGIVNYLKERSDPTWQPPPEATLVLTKDNFDEVTEREELMVVAFYAPWCGHCKRMLPEFEKAAQELQKHPSPVPLAKVDATVETDLATKYGVTGYPTMKLFRKGRVFDYKGETRDKWAILQYVDTQRGAASKELNSLNDIKKKIVSVEDGMTSIVAFFASATDKEYLTYEDAANDLRDDYKFHHTFDEKARKHFKVDPGTVIVFLTERYQTRHEPKFKQFQIKDSTASTDISDFVKKNDAPLVGEFNRASKDKTYKTRRPLVLFFYTVDWTFEHRDATQMWRKKFADIAKQYLDMTFVVVDEEENREILKEFNFDESSEEINVGIIDKNERKYSMKPMEEYESDEVIEFIQSFKKGKLKPKVKSQPVPKKSSGPVTVVVGQTFEKIVLDKKKDVLIELYAPWCGHCKSLEPIYKDLAKKLKNEKNLVIAKMDATANDSPTNYPSSGYPTIFFAPSNKKDSPISYSGERTLDGMMQFLKEHATVSLGKARKEEL